MDHLKVLFWYWTIFHQDPNVNGSLLVPVSSLLDDNLVLVNEPSKIEAVSDIEEHLTESRGVLAPAGFRDAEILPDFLITLTLATPLNLLHQLTGNVGYSYQYSTAIHFCIIL